MLDNNTDCVVCSFLNSGCVNVAPHVCKVLYLIIE